MANLFTKTLLIDMDCCLVNMLPSWLSKYNQRTGANVQIEDIVDYDLRKFCGDADVLGEILHEPGFFLDMQPMPGAVPALQELCDDGYDVVILTQPPRRAEYAVRDKRRWMRKYFPDFPLMNMIFAHRKELVRGDLLFDDKPSHLIHWKQNNPAGVAATVDWKYNQLPEVNKVVSFRGSQQNGWKDFVDFVHEIFPLK